MNESDLMKQLDAGTITLDQILMPGKALHDVDLNKLRIQVLDSGFPSLDAEYMLLKKSEGELIIVGGRPSVGKSALMFQLALYVSKSSPVHVFSLEMGHASIVRRLIAQMIGKPISAIQRGFVNPKELVAAKESLKNYDYHIDDTGGLNVDDIMDRAKSRHRKVGTGLIVVDYLQIISKAKGHSTAAEYGEISAKLKTLAKEIGCPIIAGSQLNRQCESRDDKRPMLSDLKESGSIEQDADIVLGLYSEYKYTRLRPGETDVLVLKNRNGPTGEVTLKYHPGSTQFVDKQVELV